jgi:GT2 family glycosyltransferase/glycosyltransferase involved in cell wall biosynthesis/predicted SAM-dependent methyltransferase
VARSFDARGGGQAVRVNLGCGPLYLDGWVNVDSDPDVRADVHGDAVEFIREHAESISEVYMGHLIEHLTLDDAVVLLITVAERLAAGTTVSAVTPDMRAIFRAYLDGEVDNVILNDSFVYSYVQPSHHRWCHDIESLTRLFERAGLIDIRPVDTATWAPVYYKTGENSRWQCGVRGTVPPNRVILAASGERRSDLYAAEVAPEPGRAPTAEEVLLAELRQVRAELARARQLAGTQSGEGGGGPELDEARRMLAAVHGSTTYRAAAAASGVARRLLPPGSRRRRVAKRALGRRTEPSAPPSRAVESAAPVDPGVFVTAEAALQHLAALGVARPQAFSVLVLARSGGSLAATLRSLEGQTWPHWRAAVLHPTKHRGSQSGHSGGARVEHHHGGLGAGGINAVLAEIPHREMVIFLEAGDTLAPSCLYQVAASVHRDPLIDLVSWDDEASGGGGRWRPRLRPSWSPEVLLSAPYLDRSFALRSARALVAGGVRQEAGRAKLWDLLLRCEMAGDRVSHIPQVLGRVRTTAAIPPGDAVTVVGQALERRSWPATARWRGDAVRVNWDLSSWPRVSVIVPTRHNRALVGPLLDGLARSGYPELEAVIVDNGARTPENESWYEGRPLHPTVIWWDRPFNYSAVNNAGARAATGGVLLFLNDDIRVTGDPGWLEELVGWTTVTEVGSVGIQLIDPQGRIQHGGVILGLTGFAGHLFAGLRPGSSTLLGSSSWYRDVLAVTAACVAVRRDNFESVGGFDEEFTLCGSDVALGLALRQRGLRSLCVPSNALTHLESATRGPTVPRSDYFVSWWRYQRWIRSGDPYFHPRLSVESTGPRLRRPGEPAAVELAAPHVGRRLSIWHSQDDLAQAAALASRCRIDPAEVDAVKAQHRAHSAPAAPRTVNWFIPGIDSPFYGGINTALRLATKLAADHAVENRFVVCGLGPEEYIRTGIAAAFPGLASAPTFIAETDAQLARVPAADAAIATLWTTAYQVAVHPGAGRRFYLVQDFEPMFYPAGTIYALAEESYRLGLYGICNTENLARLYRSYGGTATHFTPAVDGAVFHARHRVRRSPEGPVTLFVYARPGHWRNCWELAEAALHELKDRMGDRIRIVAAGSWAPVESGDRLPAIAHLGLLDYAETGDLYRSCDMGLALTVSEHPSYLPLELMACGTSVVCLDNPAGGWLLRDGVNCLLAPRTVDGLVDRLEAMAVNPPLRRRLAGQALKDIAEFHSDWDAALGGIYDFLTDPEGVGAADVLVVGAAGSHRSQRPAEGRQRHD